MDMFEKQFDGVVKVKRDMFQSLIETNLTFNEQQSDSESSF